MPITHALVADGDPLVDAGDWNDDHAIDYSDLSIGCLGAVQYTGAGTPWFSTSSTSLVDVDATNGIVTFNAPQSGKVLVQIQCGLAWTTSVSLARFGIRESSSDVASTNTWHTGTTADNQVTNVFLLVTGLTPSSSHTYKFAVCRASGTGTLNVYATSTERFVMSVWAVP